MGGHCAAVQEKDTAHVKSSAHEAKRDMKLKYRTVVLEVLSRLSRRDRPHTVVLKASADHAMAEFQRPDRRQSSGSVQRVVVNYPTVEYESIYREPKITQ